MVPVQMRRVAVRLETTEMRWIHLCMPRQARSDRSGLQLVATQKCFPCCRLRRCTGPAHRTAAFGRRPLQWNWQSIPGRPIQTACRSRQPRCRSGSGSGAAERARRQKNAPQRPHFPWRRHHARCRQRQTHQHSCGSPRTRLPSRRC